MGPHTRVAIAVLVVIASLSACTSDSDQADPGSASSTTTAATGGPDPRNDLQVLSSRPDMVTGGDLLVRLGTRAARDLTVDGEPATTTPGPQSTGGATVLLTGLPPGKSTIAAGSSSVEVVDHPVTGPVFSGPHLPLEVCTTAAAGLGQPTDADCSAPTKVDRVTLGNVEAKRERGVINRSIYTITVPADGWNRRLVYRFGGGCGTSYSQGSAATTAEAPDLLGAGYAVATATFNTFQVQCNDVLSAETMMMVKERFIEAYGLPDFTIGEGPSGGSIQQHLIVQNYPGLLDAVAAILPFPDAITIAPGVSDCGLLNRFFTTTDGKAFSTDQQLAVSGFGSAITCQFWARSFLSGITPSDGCDPGIAKTEIYDPDTNPRGLRCTFTDANRNSFGRDPETGFARRPLDNVGVEYGRKGLAEGVITVDQFLDLNERIGGYDIDGKPIPARTESDEESLRIAYAKGRVSSGGGDQKKVPIIDLNLYTDTAGDIHDRFRAFSLRDRLGSDNLQIWTRGQTDQSIGSVVGNIFTGGGRGPEIIAVLDQWLTSGTRPATAIDNCLDQTGKRISGVGLYERPGPCTDPYPLHDDPRTAAGAPRRNDILKCSLKPPATDDYGEISFSDAQATRLRTIFPDGVCDWTKTGVGQVALEGTWLTYG